MNGFEFAKQYNTVEEKVAVLLLDALKAAYNMAGINFDDLSESEKIEAIEKYIK